MYKILEIERTVKDIRNHRCHSKRFSWSEGFAEREGR